MCSYQLSVSKYQALRLLVKAIQRVSFRRLTPCLMRREKKLLITLGLYHRSQRSMRHILTQATPLATRLLRRFAFRVGLHLLCWQTLVLTHQKSEPRFNQFHTQKNRLAFKQWSTWSPCLRNTCGMLNFENESIH